MYYPVPRCRHQPQHAPRECCVIVRGQTGERFSPSSWRSSRAAGRAAWPLLVWEKKAEATAMPGTAPRQHRDHNKNSLGDYQPASRDASQGRCSPSAPRTVPNRPRLSRRGTVATTLRRTSCHIPTRPSDIWPLEGGCEDHTCFACFFPTGPPSENKITLRVAPWVISHLAKRRTREATYLILSSTQGGHHASVSSEDYTLRAVP